MLSKETILSNVKNRIQGIDPGAKIILFGSRVRNDFRDDSDWDFLILTHHKVNQEYKNRISDTLFEIELDTDQVLTGIVQNKQEWKHLAHTSIYKNVSNEGLVL